MTAQSKRKKLKWAAHLKKTGCFMCNYCGGSGYIIARCKEFKAVYAFKCKCWQGTKNMLPAWHSGRLKKFDPECEALRNQTLKYDYAKAAANDKVFEDLDL